VFEEEIDLVLLRKEVLRRVLREWRPDSLPKYLTRMAKNLAIDFIRGRSTNVDSDCVEWGDEAEGGFEPGPEYRALVGELQRMMRLAVQRLGENCRRVVELVDLAQHSYEEAAEALGITRNNLGVTLNRCRQRLGLTIEKEFPALKAYLEAAL